MNKTTVAIVLGVSAVVLGLGLMFLCASINAPQRLPLTMVLIAIGGGGAAWAGMTWRRLSEVEPRRLADRIVEMVRLQGKYETTAAEAVAELSAPAANVQAAIEILEQRGEIMLEQRADRQVYVFPNLKESKVERRCPYCNAQFPVKQALSQCPQCGANLELKRT
jgi:Zn finger protein HypA/HybF involved in hydrogenase expression